MSKWETPEENFDWLIQSMVNEWNGQMEALGKDTPQYDVVPDKGGYAVKSLSKADIRKRCIAEEKAAADAARELEVEFVDTELEIVDTEAVTSTDIDESALGDDAPITTN